MAGKSKASKEVPVTHLYRIRAGGAKLRTLSLRRKPTKKPVKKLRKVVPVAPTRVLIKTSLTFMWKHRKKLAGVLAIYGLLYILLVSGFGGNIDIKSIKLRLDNVFGSGRATNNLISTFIVIIGVGSSSSPTQQLYQTLLPIFGTIAFIWTIRQLFAKRKFRIRDAYYRSMQPFFALIIVELSIVLKLLPFFIGTFIFVAVRSGQLAVSMTETIFFIVVWLAALLLSLFLIVPNVLAVYAVTLPDVDPRQAILASKHMVRGQRIQVLGRALAGLLLGLIVVGLIVLATIAWANVLVGPITLMCTFVGFMAMHVYLYHVYRSML